MALKSGRVGVNPKAVDRYGMPRPGDVYTKSETDAKYATKTQVNACVPKTQLTANSKDFIFAYDETSEKYGYKAGSDGEFVPFEAAGGGVVGMNLPDATTTGFTISSDLTVESGGLQVVHGTSYDLLYGDITLSYSSTSGDHKIDLPSGKYIRGVIGVAYCASSKAGVDDLGGTGNFYIGNNQDTTLMNYFQVPLASGCSYVRLIIATRYRTS